MQTRKKKKWSKRIAGYFSKVLLLAFGILSVLLVQVAYRTYTTEQLAIELSNARKMSEEPEDWSHGMLEKNPDYKGWLKVYGTGVDNPVVQGETNDTYLRTDFYGEPNKAGTLFLDETTDTSKPGNRIIYGHKMKDRTMFGQFDSYYRDKDFWKDHRAVLWEDEQGKHYYQLFAAMVVPGRADTKGFVNIQAWNNEISEEETAEMLKTVREKACIYQDEKIAGPEPTDHYIFLVTCDYTRKDGRLVMVGREIAAE